MKNLTQSFMLAGITLLVSIFSTSGLKSEIIKDVESLHRDLTAIKNIKSYHKMFGEDVKFPKKRGSLLSQWVNWNNWGNWNNWSKFNKVPTWGNGWNNFLN